MFYAIVHIYIIYAAKYDICQVSLEHQVDIFMQKMEMNLQDEALGMGPPGQQLLLPGSGWQEY